MIHAFLKLVSNRTLVREDSVEPMARYLRADLCEKGFTQVDRIPVQVALSIVQEALRRATEKEQDGRPRYGEFVRQVEAAADSIIAAFSDEKNADPRIKNILVFHKVLGE